MKTLEEIAGTEALQSCRRCECRGHCRRLLEKLREARQGLLVEISDALVDKATKKTETT